MPEDEKTEEEQKQEATDKAAEEKAATEKATKEAGTTYEIVVSGEKKAVTLEELKTYATKAAGADQKFEEANKMRLDAEKGTHLLALADAVRGDHPSEANVKEFLHGLGVKDEDAKGIMEKISGKTEKTSGKEKEPSKISVDQLPSEVTEILDAAKTAQLENLREKIYKEVEKAIDKDEILGKMVDELPEGDRGKVKEVLYDMARNDVQRRILGNEPFGPEMVTSAVQGIRSMTKTLGMPSSAGTQVPVVGFGPSTDLTPEIVANKPIERVPSTADDYIEKITAKYQQQQYQILAAEAHKKK